MLEICTIRQRDGSSGADGYALVTENDAIVGIGDRHLWPAPQSFVRTGSEHPFGTEIRTGSAAVACIRIDHRKPCNLFTRNGKTPSPFFFIAHFNLDRKLPSAPPFHTQRGSADGENPTSIQHGIVTGENFFAQQMKTITGNAITNALPSLEGLLMNRFEKLVVTYTSSCCHQDYEPVVFFFHTTA